MDRDENFAKIYGSGGEEDSEGGAVLSEWQRRKLILWLFLEEPYLNNIATAVSIINGLLILLSLYYAI